MDIYEEAAAAFCTATFCTAAFATGLLFYAAALRTAAHLFLVAAMIALRPAALSLRFGFFTALGAAVVAFAAHLLRCASAIAFRPAALIRCFLRPVGFELGVEPSEP